MRSNEKKLNIPSRNVYITMITKCSEKLFKIRILYFYIRKLFKYLQFPFVFHKFLIEFSVIILSNIYVKYKYNSTEIRNFREIVLD